ncbi:unnamed protein product [Adineta ricciae]|uniref:Uncharacterized protein n=1 Tax=Adineta ricciae TaxID=249248 RepID=A0A815RY59_ADIRI|nr:unnamed protein product [Adineta ricciae]CAF1484217.1 unnamed protein product [Adineta ricciae]
MSNKDDEIMRRMCQMLVGINAASGSLQFDRNEFSRLPDDTQTTIEIKEDDFQQVYDALYHSLTNGFYKFAVRKNGPTIQFIAAQFKNSNMKQSQLEPRVIEAVLTKIIDNVDQYPQLKEMKCNLSYSDDGSSCMTPKGVRCFCIKAKE